ncbi:hypothetical protein J0910_21730 [Nocardiopsis sp. CNT-189]|uniref:hypothetical protein n=1 Tax=Nocardiopsis oceanisediminis TaxID=2816862 RepID=UPI003B2C4109
MDPVTLVVGGAIALGGVLIGRMLPRRERRQPQQPQAPQVTAPPAGANPQPICGCGHHIVFHDQRSKLCQAQVVIPGRWTGQGSADGVYRQCKCQGYRGPIPLDEYYAPDLLNGES